MSTARAAISLAAFLGVTALAPIIGGMATARSVNSEWFRTLNKPAWNPPDWIFGPVWTVLYILMGVAAWMVWRTLAAKAAAPDGRPPVFAPMMRVPLILYATQLALNALWSVLFFGLREPGWAFAEITLLWAAILATTIAFARVSVGAAWLMSPYLAWVSFAAALNFAIWRMNGVSLGG